MKKYSAHIIDQILLFIAVFLLTNTLLNYIKIINILSLLLSCAISVLICIIFHRKYKEKNNIINSSNKRQQHINACKQLLETYPQNLLYTYFSKALNAQLCEIKGIPLHLKYNDKITIIYGICTNMGTFLTEMLSICRFYKINQIQIILFTDEKSCSLPPSITNLININFIAFDKLYSTIEKNKMLPLIKNSEIKIKKKNVFSNFFSSVNIKPFLLAGISLIVFSNFLPLKTYYIIIGFISIIFALSSLTISLYNKNKMATT
ncbi:MAG: hypothetical protein RR334_02450 [Clostridia bacterium]